MNTLVLVDLQNDFMPGGALAVPGGHEVLPIANAVQRYFDIVVATADRHPPGHGSFASAHPGARVGQLVELAGMPQMLWPDHCVQGTSGAEFAPGLDTARIAKIIHKGMDPSIDSYSGFFDNGHRRSTGMEDYLRSRGVDAIYVMGLATDYCVKFTALDGVALGFSTYLIEDGCRGVEIAPGDVARAVSEMRAAGVRIIDSRQLGASGERRANDAFPDIDKYVCSRECLHVRFTGLVIGIPREIMKGERRVSAVPDTVKKMVADGAKVLVEKGAGEGSYFHDDQYAAAGAEIIEGAADVFAKANIILKVKEPIFNEAAERHEVDLMHAGQCIITFLHPAYPGNHKMIKDMAAKGILAFTLDGIPRISRAQAMDALTSMSTVAGYKAVLMAANRLPKFMPMVGTAVGMIKPSNVLVIGTGVAGLQAVATAKRLGAVVYAADIRPAASEQAKSVGAKVVDLGVPAELAIGEGGYALKLPEEWLLKEREVLAPVIADADIVISAALIPGKLAPILITEEMVKSMRPGSAIVDISIDQGGNCELSESGVILEKYGVSIDGTKNIPGMVPTASTWMFAQNVFNYVANLVKDGKIDVDMSDEIIASSLVTRDGVLVHAGALEAMNALDGGKKKCGCNSGDARKLN